MSCQICGRNSCVPSFHSIDEQQSFDDIADPIKKRAREYISHRLDRLDCEYIDDEIYIKLQDAQSVVEDYD